MSRVVVMLEEELAKLLEGTSDAAFSVDLQGEIRTWNKAAEELFGYPASFAVGKPCAGLIGGRITTNLLVCRQHCDIIECARTDRDISNFDMEIGPNSAPRSWVNVSILVACNGRTQRRLVIHFVRDIRKKKRALDLTSRVLRIARRLVSNADAVDETDEVPLVSSLTEQEKKILSLLAAGNTSKEVAGELQISMLTVRNHLSHVNHKLHTRNRLEAVLQARKKGLI
jgi:PAS domain S-box-containing protein